MKINIDEMKLYNTYRLYDKNGILRHSKTYSKMKTKKELLSYARRWIIDNHHEDLAFGIEYIWKIGGTK